MKRIIPFLLSVSLLYSCHQEEEISLPTDGPVINLAELGLSENDVVQGRMRIKTERRTCRKFKREEYRRRHIRTN